MCFYVGNGWEKRAGVPYASKELSLVMEVPYMCSSFVRVITRISQLLIAILMQYLSLRQMIIFKRPFLDDFLGFFFERFDVAIWSSRTRKILDPVIDYLLGDLKKMLVFIWDISHCTN
ncbi:putative FCP1 domain, HAD superfamily protein [Helianthus annuus]|nr:putative FCP1 domain, HAD superfamily protein [Helianthus annuus]